MNRLDQIPRDWIIKAALRILSKTKYRKASAWVAVTDLCGVGSFSAIQICTEIGVDPHKPYNPNSPT